MTRARTLGQSVLIVLTLGSAASADPVLDVGDGALSLRTRLSGFSLVIQVRSPSKESHWNFGNEFKATLVRMESFPLYNAGARSYSAGGAIQYVFAPNRISPYVGLGALAKATGPDYRQVDARRTILDAGDLGRRIRADGIIGARLPLGSNVLLFAEGRLGVGVEFSGIGEGMVIEKSRGPSWAVGLSCRF